MINSSFFLIDRSDYLYDNYLLVSFWIAPLEFGYGPAE